MVQGMTHGLMTRMVQDMTGLGGVFQFDPSSCRPGGLTPGKIRALIQNARPGATEKELQRMSTWKRFMRSALTVTGSVGEWCVQSLLDTIIQHVQLHITFNIDGAGVPYFRFHTRLKMFGVFETPWKYMCQVAINGEMTSMVNSALQVWAKASLMYSSPESLSIAEVWTAPINHPLFPQGVPDDGGASSTSSDVSASASPCQHLEKANHEHQASTTAWERWGGRGGGIAQCKQEEGIAECKQEVSSDDEKTKPWFLVRTQTWDFNSEGIVQAGAINGVGPYAFRWIRVGQQDRALIDFDREANGDCHDAMYDII
eukprot:Tamp_15315.p1 GENE.Tamp_15315~~Tamp_15315.p1  ORF type:complete len:314 (+),score=36.72 Tamp_15315:3-944(+)